MAFQHDEVIKAQFDRLTADRALAMAEYEAGRTARDEASTMYAADRLLEVDAKLAALGNIANRMVASQHQQAQGNRYGLSPDEVEVANGTASADPHLTQDQRQQLYAQNKQKLAYQRQTGQYRDDQGSVRR